MYFTDTGIQFLNGGAYTLLLNSELQLQRWHSGYKWPSPPIPFDISLLHVLKMLNDPYGQQCANLSPALLSPPVLWMRSLKAKFFCIGGMGEASRLDLHCADHYTHTHTHIHTHSHTHTHTHTLTHTHIHTHTRARP